MDSGTMDEIMKNNSGVSAMISSMETAMSTRALEETARTIARLASSPKNVPQLIESGALTQIGRVLKSKSSAAQIEMKASMILALDRICAASPQSLAVMLKDPAVFSSLIETLAANPTHPTLCKASLDLFSRLAIPKNMSPPPPLFVR